MQTRSFFTKALVFALTMLVGVILSVGCGRSDLDPGNTDGSIKDGGGDGSPGTCNPITCPSGCCDSTGTCRDGSELKACGSGGQKCDDCFATGFERCDKTIKVCATNQPTCNAGTCPTGCCTTISGQTACVSGVSSLACGQAGATCTDCAAKAQVCNAATRACETPTCGSNNCKGCCNGGFCLAGNDNANCGINGQACTTCSSSTSCTITTGKCDGPPPLCNSTNCKGCCAGNVCVNPATDAQCGIAGGACTNCTASSAKCDVSSGKCTTPTCNTTNCVGCCDSTQTCYAGFVDSRCGSNGNTCLDCTSKATTCDVSSSPRTCKGGTSTCPATYSSCPSTVTTPTLAVTKSACTNSDLADAKAGCTGGYGTIGCDAFFTTIKSVNNKCYTCLQPFAYPLLSGTGIYNCVSPYVSTSCNHNTGCVADCVDKSCTACPSSSKPSCESSVRSSSGQCFTYITSTSCIAGALFGSASFCSPTMYSNNYGSWLAGVGLKYCQ